MQYVIETKRLCKTYGGRTVVHNLDLHVPQGCVYCVWFYWAKWRG